MSSNEFTLQKMTVSWVIKTKYIIKAMNQKLQNTLIWIYFILPSYQQRSCLIIFVSKESIKNFYVEKNLNVMQIQKEIKSENGV